jgi:predicted phosphoribosyltransferase
MFADRADAGERLADELTSRGIEADLVVGVPRGGLPVAEAVAQRLGAPLDVVVAKKIALPNNQEYAIGAVTAGGETWYDDRTVEQLTVDESALAKQEANAHERAVKVREAFRDDRPPLAVAGKRVIVVDDGLATGATMRACVRQLVDNGAEAVVVAVPVASPTSVPPLQLVADEVIALRTPERFRAVGQFYDSFDQVPTVEAVEFFQESAAVW